jgi:cytochrome c oxidase cbb3-type subunit 3
MRTELRYDASKSYPPLISRSIKSLFITASLAFTAPVFAQSASDYCGQEAAPCLQYGAAVFQQRCALCHGSDGLGEGPLSLSVKDYPAANLMEPRVATDGVSLRRSIIEGSRFADINPLMPPWGDELTLTQLDSVIMFVGYLRKDLEGALKIARVAASKVEPSVKLGRAVFIGRCALCHGQEATGDGRMAARLEPKPVNLTKSRAPDSYLKMVISKGGEAVGRSAKMPSWEGDLSGPEIDSIVLFINTLRPAPKGTTK